MNLYELYKIIPNGKQGLSIDQLVEKTGSNNEEVCFYVDILERNKKIKRLNSLGFMDSNSFVKTNLFLDDE